MVDAAKIYAPRIYIKTLELQRDRLRDRIAELEHERDQLKETVADLQYELRSAETARLTTIKHIKA
jgi:chromosome segregation ATPase